jgi:translation initiation factor IF-3
VRVLDEKGKQIGILTIAEALEKAQKLESDLIEIAPQAKPPVAKIIEFGKFRYQEEKSLKKQKSGVRGGDLKEIRFSPFIGEADYQTRLQRINEFLSDGHKVRPVVKFKGRQMGSKRFGYELLERLLKDVEGKINVDMEPKFIGRHLIMVISPTKNIKVSKDAKTENQEINH